MPALVPTYARSELSFARGEGAYLFTASGERYLDFASGVAVTALGHAHPHLVRTLSEQAKKLWHVSNLHRIPEQERLAERLCAATFADMAFFANSGAEAVECAIKAARRYHFKARRAGALSACHLRRRLPWQDARNHRRRRTGEASRGLWPAGRRLRPGRCASTSPRSRRRSATGTAGILIEPIMGEGGMREVPDALPARFARARRRERDLAPAR